MFTLEELFKWSNTVCINNRWVPARPMLYSIADRIKAAFAVLIGRADAVIWPEGQ